MSEVVHHEMSRQPYADCVISAGVVEGKPPEEVYLKFERPPEEPTTIYMRSDEAQAVMTVLSGAMWSLLIAEMED